GGVAGRVALVVEVDLPLVQRDRGDVIQALALLIRRLQRGQEGRCRNAVMDGCQLDSTGEPDGVGLLQVLGRQVGRDTGGGEVGGDQRVEAGGGDQRA